MIGLLHAPRMIYKQLEEKFDLKLDKRVKTLVKNKLSELLSEYRRNEDSHDIETTVETNIVHQNTKQNWTKVEKTKSEIPQKLNKIEIEMK